MYKRQNYNIKWDGSTLTLDGTTINGGIFKNFLAEDDDLTAVSYTHLDVYKRQLIVPPGAVETASAAIFIISGTTGLIAVKSRLLLHEQFKCPLLAFYEIHSGCTSFPAGITKRRYFLPKRG